MVSFQFFLEALNTRRSCIGLSPFLLFVLLLLSPHVLRLLIFFAPLLLSTAVCTAVIFIFVFSDKLPAREMPLSDGEKIVFRLFQVYNKVNCSAYNEQIQAACFLVNSSGRMGVLLQDDNSEEMVLAGRLEVSDSNAISDEDVSSLEVDGMAEDLWNCYLGRFSRWHA